MLKLAPLWVLVTGVAVFMVFFTIIEMPNNSILTPMLTAVWAGVALFSSILTMGEFKESRATSSEEFKKFHQQVRRRNARRRQQQSKF